MGCTGSGQAKQKQKAHKSQNTTKTQKKQAPKSKLDSDKIGLQCPICITQVTLSTVCPISCCHNLHRSCFIQYFKSKVQIKKFPIMCPMLGCNQEIDIGDLQQYIPKELMDKYYQFCLHQFVEKNKNDTNWCPTPGCPAVFSIQGELQTYQCPTCYKQYCLSCKTQSHEGISCQVNKLRLHSSEQDKKFIKYAQGARMKQCPNCKYWVDKIQGCDHMTCRCGYEFCYSCGGQYGECDCEGQRMHRGLRDSRIRIRVQRPLSQLDQIHSRLGQLEDSDEDRRRRIPRRSSLDLRM